MPVNNAFKQNVGLISQKAVVVMVPVRKICLADRKKFKTAQSKDWLSSETVGLLNDVVAPPISKVSLCTTRRAQQNYIMQGRRLARLKTVASSVQLHYLLKQYTTTLYTLFAAILTLMSFATVSLSALTFNTQMSSLLDHSLRI